jgi:hypothetical protein
MAGRSSKPTKAASESGSAVMEYPELERWVRKFRADALADGYRSYQQLLRLAHVGVSASDAVEQTVRLVQAYYPYVAHPSDLGFELYDVRRVRGAEYTLVFDDAFAGARFTIGNPWYIIFAYLFEVAGASDVDFVVLRADRRNMTRVEQEDLALAIIDGMNYELDESEYMAVFSRSPYALTVSLSDPEVVYFCRLWRDHLGITYSGRPHKGRGALATQRRLNKGRHHRPSRVGTTVKATRERHKA